MELGLTDRGWLRVERGSCWVGAGDRDDVWSSSVVMFMSRFYDVRKNSINNLK